MEEDKVFLLEAVILVVVILEEVKVVLQGAVILVAVFLEEGIQVEEDKVALQEVNTLVTLFLEVHTIVVHTLVLILPENKHLEHPVDMEVEVQVVFQAVPILLKLLLLEAVNKVLEISMY